MNATRLLTKAEVEQLFDDAMSGLRFVDVHVHDMPEVMGPELALSGPDALIDYHYLYGEVLSDRALRAEETEKLWARPREERVNFLVSFSYGDGALPLSEARLGILTAAKALGLPTGSGDFSKLLGEWRALYRDLGVEAYSNRIFELAGIDRVVSTQSPFVPAECERYLDDSVIEKWDPRYWCGLRFDEFAHKPDTTKAICEKLGFPEAATPLGTRAARLQANKLLEFWIDRLPNVKYVALSLPGTVNFSDLGSRVMDTLVHVMIPVCKERGLPLFLMPFVRRQINPAYRNAGDVVQRGDVNGLIDFISRHPDVMFAVTPLDEGDNYALSFATRALGNLRLWGHWWCNLNPVLIESQLRLRLENNGYAHFGVNSDARVRDQLLFKFPHYFRILKKVLVERSMDIQELSGWPITMEQMRKTILRLQDHERLFNFFAD